MNTRDAYVYIMTNHSRTLYIGVTNDIARRVWEHKTGAIKGFTSKYKLTQLAYYETWSSFREAIVREKQLKGWLRSKKTTLIEGQNPAWDDLASGWYGHQDSSLRSE